MDGGSDALNSTDEEVAAAAGPSTAVPVWGIFRAGGENRSRMKGLIVRSRVFFVIGCLFIVPVRAVI